MRLIHAVNVQRKAIDLSLEERQTGPHRGRAARVDTGAAVSTIFAKSVQPNISADGLATGRDTGQS